jgi:hypothetical protein
MTAQSGLGFSGIVAIQIPDDGATGEVLTKLTPDNYDYDWLAGGGGGGQVDSVSGGVNINVTGTAVDPIVNLDAAISGVSVNAVTLTAAGVATNFLDETGAYSVPAGTGGQVDSVSGGVNINVTGTAVDPIVNLDAAISGVSVNGVTLSAAGAATDFLNETGAYSVPPGTGITVEEEGVPLATLATSLDFVGASITASGVGSTKTITAVDQVVTTMFLSGLFLTILNLTQTFGASPISVDLAPILGLQRLQIAYDTATTPPQINVNAVPDPVTFDATVAGDVFAVRDLANADLIRLSTTGGSIFGGSNASNILNLQGTQAANRGTINTHGTILVDFNWNTDIGFAAVRWGNLIGSSGAGVVTFMQLANIIVVDAATFISSAVDDFSNLRWTTAPGFAVQTLFFARPTYASTSVGIAPSQCFIYAAQAQYHLTGAGSVAVNTYRALSFAPIIRVDNAGDELHLLNTTGVTLQPLFNTRNATAVADYGTIRGVHMVNASTILFGLGIGSEIATNWIGLDVEVLTGLVVSGNRIAVRSAIINAAVNFLILNTGGAQSDFGAGNVHVDDDTSFSMGNVIATPDAEMQWLPANNALDLSGGRTRVRGAMEYPPITPAALGAGNTNDWTGLLTDAFSAAMRHWARISGNATTSVLTGIDATAAEDGDTFDLTNIGVNAIEITDEDVASLAANRIITATNDTYTLEADETIKVRYDTTDLRWRIIDKAAPPLQTLHLSGDQFRRGVTAPTDVTIGSTPTIAALQFALVGELASLYHSFPEDLDRNHDITLRLQFSLAAVETNGDTCDFTCDYTAPTVATGAGIAKASTQVTGQFTAVTGRLAIGDMYTMDITFPFADATNPIAVALGIAFEIHLTNTTGVGLIDLVDGDFIYTALRK